MENFSLEDSKCLLKLQEYALQEIPGLTAEKRKIICDRINRNALNNLLDPYLGEMRATNEIEIIKNKILNGFPDSSRLEVAMGVIAMAMPLPNRATKPITILASEVEIDALIKIGEDSCANVYKLGKDHVLKTLHWGEEEARMMAESINYLAEHIPAITPVVHTGGNRLVQKHIQGYPFDELPESLRSEAKALFQNAIYDAYAKAHHLQTRGIRAEIDPEMQNFLFQHEAGKITDIHWIDPVNSVTEHSPAR